MKILVTVKQVPDTSGKVAVNPDGTLDRASMQTIINPDDLNAVEAALALKDELGCKVVAFTMGPPPAEGMLRELMAMGVDEGVLVTAREFGGSDTYATSQIIAAAEFTAAYQHAFVRAHGQQLTQHAHCRRGTHGNNNYLAAGLVLQLEGGFNGVHVVRVGYGLHGGTIQRTVRIDGNLTGSIGNLFYTYYNFHVCLLTSRPGWPR